MEQNAGTHAIIWAHAHACIAVVRTRSCLFCMHLTKSAIRRPLAFDMLSMKAVTKCSTTLPFPYLKDLLFSAACVWHFFTLINILQILRAPNLNYQLAKLTTQIIEEQYT